MTSIQALLSEAIDHLVAHGIPLVITGPQVALRYEIDGVSVSEGEIVARAFALGMAGAERMQ